MLVTIGGWRSTLAAGNEPFDDRRMRLGWRKLRTTLPSPAPAQPTFTKQIPADRVAEVHLFPAIRQGGVESGVAVIALERAQPPITLDVDGGYVPPSDVAEAVPIGAPQPMAALNSATV